MRNAEDWTNELNSRITELADGCADRRDMAAANADMIERATRGLGPDKNAPVPDLGARMAVNLAAVHVPKLCAGAGQDYKNGYDLGNVQLIGTIPPGATIPLRTLVDDLLSGVTGESPKRIYFGAVELNGSGIRFYGDVCLVLKPEDLNGQTIVLISNSYDLVRPPATQTGVAPISIRPELENYADQMAGRWGRDLPAMAALKTFALRLVTERRLTTGQISAAVLEDEDYFEILKVGSFRPANLQEARVSATDTAAETQIGENLRLGRCPSLAELQWRKHRRAASTALDGKGVRTRVITTSGRVRS